ncbi:hypothetical protein VTO73DRAFT_5434 [Trametes versicolor]
MSNLGARRETCVNVPTCYATSRSSNLVTRRETRSNNAHPRHAEPHRRS